MTAHHLLGCKHSCCGAEFPFGASGTTPFQSFGLPYLFFAGTAAVATYGRYGGCETEASCYRGTERGFGGNLALCALNAFDALSNKSLQGWP
jgi:hypothetical protein